MPADRSTDPAGPGRGTSVTGACAAPRSTPAPTLPPPPKIRDALQRQPLQPLDLLRARALPSPADRRGGFGRLRPHRARPALRARARTRRSVPARTRRAPGATPPVLLRVGVAVHLGGRGGDVAQPAAGASGGERATPV